MNRQADPLQKITPHLCLAEWGRADMETILRDAMISAENGLTAISALPDALSAIGNAAAAATKIYCFIDDAGRIPELAGRNAAVQLFLKDNHADDVAVPPDMEVIPAFALENINYLDWPRVMSAADALGGFGFMFIDDDGKYLHRFYNFLDLVGESFGGAIHYCGATNDPDTLDDARRLVEKVRPNLLPNLRLFVSADFFRNLDIRGKSV